MKLSNEKSVGLVVFYLVVAVFVFLWLENFLKIATTPLLNANIPLPRALLQRCAGSVSATMCADDIQFHDYNIVL